MDKILRLISILLILQNPLAVLAKRVKAKDIKIERINLLETGFRNKRKLLIELTNKSKIPARLSLEKDWLLYASQNTIDVPAKSTVTKTIELSLDEEAYLKKLKNNPNSIQLSHDANSDTLRIAFNIQYTQDIVAAVLLKTVSYFSVKRECQSIDLQTMVCNLTTDGDFAKDLNLSIKERRSDVDPYRNYEETNVRYFDTTKSYEIKKLSATKFQYIYRHSKYCKERQEQANKNLYGRTMPRITNTKSQAYWEIIDITDDYSLSCNDETVNFKKNNEVRMGPLSFIANSVFMTALIPAAIALAPVIVPFALLTIQGEKAGYFLVKKNW